MVKVGEDLTGKVFGRLTVLERADDYKSSSGRYYAMWLCKCSCEQKNTVIVRHQNLKSKNTKSCGCYRKNRAIESHKKENEYRFDGDVCYGFASNKNVEFMFDANRYDDVKKYCWYVNNHGYVSTNIRKDDGSQTLLFLHQLICPTDFDCVDHKNRNKLDNRMKNLRPATKQQNALNTDLYANNSSGIRGVRWNKEICKWHSYIVNNGKQINIGYFEDINDAIRSRLLFEFDLWGDNSPQKELFLKYGIIDNLNEADVEVI